MEPRRVATAAGELASLEEQPHENLLSGILGVVFGSHQPPAHAPDAFPIPIHQRREGDTIGPLASRLGREFLIRTRWVIGLAGRLHAGDVLPRKREIPDGDRISTG
ncbi:MAG: hypothetical protein ACKO4T_10000 [Planctomycetaceae bacterium]